MLGDLCAAIGALILCGLAGVLGALATGVALRERPIGADTLAWALAVLIGVDVTVNALFGGRIYSTISCRIGESIRAGGWASRVPWPAWWVAHCLGAIHSAIV